VDFPPEVSFFSLNFSCFGRYSGKKLVKMGSENGKMLENRKRKWIYLTGCDKFFKFLRHFSKKFEKFALKTLIFSKTGNGSEFFTGSKLFFTKFLMFWAL
jgi:hypothetical protein